jgi:mxaA protein
MARLALAVLLGATSARAYAQSDPSPASTAPALSPQPAALDTQPSALGAQPRTPAPVVTLRDTGYLLGDLVDEHIELALPQGATLDRDSLPLPGRVAPWLELRSARIDAEKSDAVALTVTYQVFAEVEQPDRVPLPAFKLRLRGDGAGTLDVPEQSILVSPALPAALGDRDRELKPSPAPQPWPIRGAVSGLAAALGLALAAGAYLLWVHDRLPFLPRAPGPFARAWRRWRRRGRRELSADERARLLRDWHAALNGAAGETVYVGTLPRLFARAPHLEPLRSPLERLFESSWRHFYDAAAAPAQDEVLRLLRSAAERERGVPC